MKAILSTFLTATLATTMLVVSADAGFAASRRSTCKAYAKREANHYANASVGTGLVAGAAGGALFGTLLSGHKGTVPGLVVGGVGGTMLGAINGAEKKRIIYREAYADCMSNY